MLLERGALAQLLPTRLPARSDKVPGRCLPGSTERSHCPNPKSIIGPYPTWLYWLRLLLYCSHWRACYVFCSFCKVRHFCCTPQPSCQSAHPHGRSLLHHLRAARVLIALNGLWMSTVITALYDWVGVEAGRWIWVAFKQKLTFGNFSEIPKATSGWICFPSLSRPSCIFHALGWPQGRSERPKI